MYRFYFHAYREKVSARFAALDRPESHGRPTTFMPRVAMGAQMTTHVHPDRAYGNIARSKKRPADSPADGRLMDVDFFGSLLRFIFSHK